jgi:hypothetical protein
MLDTTSVKDDQSAF